MNGIYDETLAEERDYFLDCGCYSAWPDHRCLGGRRPDYCTCGAPDDCYCPSPAERYTEMLDGAVFPALVTLVFDDDDRRQWMTHNLSDAIVTILSNDHHTTLLLDAARQVWTI